MNKLNKKLEKHIDLLIKRYPVLDVCSENLIAAYLIMEEAYTNDKKLLIAGNGGSAADSEHIAGELMKSFKCPRPIDKEISARLEKIAGEKGKLIAEKLEKGLMAIPLVAHEALTTAYSNDVDGEYVFAQQLLGFGRKNDVFLGITTSGNSKNVINAAIIAKALEMKVIALTGINGGKIKELADVTIKVPEKETFMIQELHLPIYHCLCLMLEERFFGNIEE